MSRSSYLRNKMITYFDLTYGMHECAMVRLLHCLQVVKHKDLGSLRARVNVMRNEFWSLKKDKKDFNKQVNTLPVKSIKATRARRF